MANIQSGINQFISQSAILARLSPGFDTRQTAHKLKKQENVLKKEHAVVGENLKNENVSSESMEHAENTMQRIVDLRQAQFQNQPSEKSFENLQKATKGQKQIKQTFTELQSYREARDKAAQQVQQKMSFDDFKKQLTIKDLPKEMQEKAYNEYTSKK